MKKIYSFSIAVILAATTNAQSIVDFESFGLNPESYDNGSAGNGDFTIGDLTFTNYYNASWMSWNGFTVSNTTDVTTAGYLNDFSAFTGTGANGTSTYAIHYPSGIITGAANIVIENFKITNGTYPAINMRDGDAYTKQFGSVNGIDGNPDGTNGEDFLKVWIIGENESGTAKDSVDFYLADYRFSDNNLDYIVDTWENIDLTTLNVPVNKLSFRFESSDVNPAGPWINTPTYFAIDEISYKSVLGLNSVENDFVNIWPNPATDRISVTGMEGSLTLTALNGQNVFSTIHKDITSIDMSTFQKGIYFLTLTTENSILTEKVVLR